MAAAMVVAEIIPSLSKAGLAELYADDSKAIIADSINDQSQREADSCLKN
jgi:hypothetical protein